MELTDKDFKRAIINILKDIKKHVIMRREIGYLGSNQMKILEMKNTISEKDISLDGIISSRLINLKI